MRSSMFYRDRHANIGLVFRALTLDFCWREARIGSRTLVNNAGIDSDRLTQRVSKYDQSSRLDKAPSESLSLPLASLCPHVAQHPHPGPQQWRIPMGLWRAAERPHVLKMAGDAQRLCSFVVAFDVSDNCKPSDPPGTLKYMKFPGELPAFHGLLFCAKRRLMWSACSTCVSAPFSVFTLRSL